jgi:polygalacturonase
MRRIFALIASVVLFASGFGTVPVHAMIEVVSNAQVAPQTLRSDEVTLLWGKLSDQPGVTYDLLRDGRRLATTPKTHFTAKGLEPEHDYVFAVVTHDANGRELHRTEDLKVRTKPREQVVSVETFGAKGDGTTLNTKAIQAAIDACPANGVVLIPQGVFVSGALFLKSDMTLQVDGTLKGSTALADYEPFILNRFEGWELKTYASLLNAGTLDHSGKPNVHALSIRGTGTIDGGGEILAKAMIDAHGLRSRGRLLCLMNCDGLEIQGVTLEHPPCWTLHYLYCQNVTCHDLAITTAIRNGDGIDPDSSKNSYIIACTFDTGDDCIAIKSGKNPEGNVINQPTEYVEIRDCRFNRGHGISIGSETSGGVRNVIVEDCVAGALLNGLQIKSTKERGNVVENVIVRDCDLQMITVLTALPYNNDGEPAPAPPYFRNFRFENLDLSSGKPDSIVINLNGFSAEGHRTTDVTFGHVKLPRGAVIKVDECDGVTFRDVTTVDGGKPKYEVTRSERVKW